MRKLQAPPSYSYAQHKGHVMNRQPIVQYPHQRGGNPWDEAPGWIQQRRTVTHSQIFWLNMSIPFTSVAGELQSALTNGEGFDCIVRSAWSDLTQARVRMKETQTDREWSSPQIPVRTFAGNSTQAQPLVPLPQPVFLEARAQLQGAWINSGTEPAGRVDFYAEIIGNERHVGDGQILVTKSQAFFLQCDLSTTTSVTQPANSDVLIWGAVTNCGNAIIGRITNETTNFSWSSQQIPLRAMAGVDGQVQPRMLYHRPYLLPANVQLRADINTAISGNYITFLAERILA